MNFIFQHKAKEEFAEIIYTELFTFVNNNYKTGIFDVLIGAEDTYNIKIINVYKNKPK